MLEAVRLEYDSISSTCAAIIGEITDSFSAILKSSASLYRSTGSRSTGLVLAGLNMLGHYMDVSTKTTVLRQELVKFTDKIKKDAVTIKTDMSRLFVIYRTLNELYIPRARLFSSTRTKCLPRSLTGSSQAFIPLRNCRRRKGQGMPCLKNTRTCSRKSLMNSSMSMYIRQVLRQTGSCWRRMP